MFSMRSARFSAIIALAMVTSLLLPVAPQASTSTTTSPTYTLSSYDRLQQQITDLKAEAAAMKAKLDAGDTTVTTTTYNLKLQQIADLEAAASALQQQQLETSTTGGINSASTSSGNNSGSGGTNIGSTVQQALIAGALSSLLGGKAGNTATSNPLGNLLGGTTTAPTGLAGATPTGNTATGGNTSGPTTTAAAKQAAAKAAAAKASLIKACKAAAAATPPADNSPGAQIAQNGSIDTGQTHATTDTAAGKAADDDLTSGGKVDNSPGKQIAKTGSATPAVPNCSSVDYTQANPMAPKGPNANGTDTDAMNGSKLTSADAIEARRLALNGQCDFDPAKNTRLATGAVANQCECASLVKANSNLGGTTSWTKGDPVQGNTNLAVGTPVATFCSGNSYGSGVSGCSHAAIYMGQDSNYMYVYNQYNGSGGGVYSKIPWASWNGHDKEGGSQFYTINSAASSFLFFGIPSYLPYLARALTLWPQGEGLANG